jgi:hypothetical protein
MILGKECRPFSSSSQQLSFTGIVLNYQKLGDMFRPAFGHHQANSRTTAKGTSRWICNGIPLC